MDNANDFIRVPYGQTVHGHEEIDAVIEVLNTSTQMGPKVAMFEKEISNLFGKEYGIMTNSGSSALFLGVEALDLPPNSEVITPALTFSTTVGCLVKNNLRPSFVDVKEDTYCIDENLIKEKVNSNTSAIIAPDLLGNICNWTKIKEIADSNNLKIIHDSADALGSSYINGKPVGQESDISITSFYGSHVINGAGNGGMLVTNSKAICDKSKLLRSWGRSSSLFSDSEAIENRFNVNLSGIRYDAKFIFEEIGYQLEPSEISAAFGLVQLKHLKENIKRRKEVFEKHNAFFRKYEDKLILPKQNQDVSTGWLAYPLQVRSNSKLNRTEIQIFLEKRNIQTRVVFTGNILRQPGFRNIDCIGVADDFVYADQVMKNGFLLGCHHGLTDEQIKHMHDSFDLFMDG